ncbi:MAG: hypothetical protein LUH05_03735 [Candidatus Gastranaerophilales bacterium]|nr:hypothetical protein [Candidatus Gastranaerophilales bacterium]
MILTKINQKQAEFGLNDDGLSLSYQQLQRSMSTSNSQELSELYDMLSECTNDD